MHILFLRTDELFTLLQNIQSDVNVFHLDIPNTDAFLEVDQEIWKQILTLRESITTTHYTIIQLGMIFHLYLNDMYNKYPNNALLELQSHLEHLLVTYNSHNPYAHLLLEEQRLQLIKVVPQISYSITPCSYLTIPPVRFLSTWETEQP